MDTTTIQASRTNVSFVQRLRAHIKLADPVTWISPTLTTFCGAVASGWQGGFSLSNPRHLALAALAALMTGPLCTGFSQSINDYYDRELDAINDPSRPIPSGRVSLFGARVNFTALALATMLVSLVLAQYNPLIPLLAVVGLVLSAIYSIPPIKLKKHFWLGPPAVGFGYVAMSWVAAHLIFAPMTWESLVVAGINGGLATGLLFLNDIKSVEGDRKHGLQSLTVAMGERKALLVAYSVIAFFEIVLLVLAAMWGHPYLAGFVLLALVVPIYSQVRLYREPNHKNFLRYMVASNPFVALIQFISAFVVGGYFG
ncbi:MAG: UbiA family prenyltransferase [Chloroflexaceae bacterium]|jgi:chlorophyll synthase/bacteriochlorophyll c synthase|nr:UbiA family prenyltransferase [Chloroflexaceae bacterium]